MQSYKHNKGKYTVPNILEILFSFNLNITKLYVLKISSKLGSGFSGQKRTVWEKNFKSYSPLMVPDTVYLNQKKKNYIKHGAKYACAYHQTFHTYS